MQETKTEYVKKHTTNVINWFEKIEEKRLNTITIG